MSSPRVALFTPPAPDLARGLEGFGEILDRVCPLRAKHRAALPGGVRKLSAFLTTDRDELPRDYMTRPEYLAAYLRWFLPWNLYRQGLLLQGLDLSLPAGSRIVDLGAGPLTFPLALWLSRPHLRERQLEYLAVDRAEAALQAGMDLFAAVAGPEAAAWKIGVERSMAGQARLPRADLLIAGNFLNELNTGTGPRRRGRGAEIAEEQESVGTDQESRLLDRWEKMISTGGALLLIEPGTRPSGRQLARIRQAALGRGWQIAAPCPHAGDCPQPGTKGGPWCHFTFSPDGAPGWLQYLARKVKLPKERASLSFLLLTRPGSRIGIRSNPRIEKGQGHCLVVSEPFDLPGRMQGRYGCTEKGLVLLEEKSGGFRDPDRTQPALTGPYPGDMLVVRWPDESRRDPKSGALVLSRAAAGQDPPPSGRRDSRNG